MNSKLKMLALMVVVAWFVAGCNTMEGVGKDVEKSGEAIQKSAK